MTRARSNPCCLVIAAISLLGGCVGLADDDIPYANCARNPTHPRCDLESPSVDITSPVSGATVDGQIAISGTASDNRMVARVEVQVDGGSFAPATGTTSWTFVLDTTALANGPHAISARAADSAGNVETTSIELEVSNATTPPATDRGPQPSITCPAGAVDILPGTDTIGPAVSAHPGGTTFCLRAGLFRLTRSVTPRSGDTFVGEYGAILDGTGWSTSDLEEAAFRAVNQDINDVVIRNLVIRNMPQRGVNAVPGAGCVNRVCTLGVPDGADRWTLENNEIAFNAVGVVMPDGSTVRNNIIHHNVGPEPFSPTPSLRGGGYMLFLVVNTTFDNNEIAYNGMEQKMALCRNVVFRNNFFHHNMYNALWYDSENTGWLAEGNTFEDNAGAGVFDEANGQGVIRDNIFRRNETGISVTASHDADIYGNTLEDNFRAITYFVDCEAIQGPVGGAIGEQVFLQDVAAHDNLIRVGAEDDVLATGFSHSACTAEEAAAFTSGSKNLTFFDNTYEVANVSGALWIWGQSRKSWSAWQAVPQDAGSTLAPR